MSAGDTHWRGAQTKPTLITALSASENDAAAFFSSLSPEEFVFRVGSAWTPGEHLDHLNIAVSLAARGFSVTRWILRLRFGRARRPSRGYHQLVADYRARLDAGAGATGRFVPARQELAAEQRSQQQHELLARWHRVNARLRVFFTIYHN